MSSPPKRWNVRPQLPTENRSRFGNMNQVMAQVLYNRGIPDYQSAMSFLEHQDVLHNPMQMKGMQDALVRIRTAIKKKEPIVIYGDFDADGVTSTVLLVQTLKGLGANVRPYIPHRVDEGYGLNTPALLQLAEEGAKLVITVDCGVRSVDEVREAMAAGLDIIITDHHSIGDEIPSALAVINPKQVDCKYPEDMLAGVGIAFKLADALIRVHTANERNAPSITTEKLLDLVALGTIADLAPLDRLENRTLVLLGLKELNRAHRPGIFALLNVAGVEPGSINAMSIGFGLGPRINAAGRLGSAMIAYDLLNTDDFEEAMQLAQQLQDLNIQRQEMTQQAQDEARELALMDGQGDVPLIFAAAAQFQAGIVGLVAGRLVEEFYRPAIVIELGEEESRGSCRSIVEFNITDALDQCADLLLRHGGHAQAAGFTILTQNIPAFREKIMGIAGEHLKDQTIEPAITIDARISLSQASLDLARALERLEPTGQSNDAPLFMTERVKVMEARAVGKDGNHLKLKVSDGPINIDGIAFRLGEMAGQLRPSTYIDIVYRLEVNEWNNHVKPQINVQDLRVSGS
jgi:single-stranded-DNA-specific exonuclease